MRYSTYKPKKLLILFGTKAPKVPINNELMPQH